MVPLHSLIDTQADAVGSGTLTVHACTVKEGALQGWKLRKLGGHT